MGKRKVNGKPFGEATRDTSDDARLAIRTFEDVADSEDEFHIERDRVLLDEGPAQKRRRRQEEHDEFLEPSDEEVMIDDEALDAESQEEGETFDIAAGNAPTDSEDDVRSQEDEEVGGWGISKKDYYDADVIETEADALEEEAEALRLQKKQLSSMTAADFGFDETEWLDADKDDGGRDARTIKERIPQLQVPEDMGAEERRKLLSARYPEFVPLAKEYLELRSQAEDIKMKATATESTESFLRNSSQNGTQQPNAPTISTIALIKRDVLFAYLASLSMYFTLLASPQEDHQGIRKPMNPTQLRDHPIMDFLLLCRQRWLSIRDVPIPDVADLVETSILPAPTVGEDNQGLQEDQPMATVLKSAGAPRKKKSKVEQELEKAAKDAAKRREERMQKTEENLKKLPTALPKSSRKRSSTTVAKTDAQDDSDFGEEAFLTNQEAAEKAKRKKTLQFYTSQIAQKANRRENAGMAAGGDDDIPHRERLKDRQARLNAEAESRGKSKKVTGAGAALGGESDEEDQQAAKEVRGEAGSDDDYYDLVAQRNEKKKATKDAFAQAAAEATQVGGVVRVVEEVGADGKRAITYAIEKNKGLTPKRNKDVRNPRVKKRKKYEDKQKKLRSVRQVYKGGEGRGGYGGELTGIKKGLVRSVKL
ncbi:hypothetical protein MMC25_001713 [Agyrium rufum]|nr:hypothetical protein [Agyrium rufum]